MRALPIILILFLFSCEKHGEFEILRPIHEFTDVRDGNIYEYIDIGFQTWMAENLAYIDYDYYPDTIDFTVIHEKPTMPLFYNNGDYGVLYNWYAAIAVAPEGWHIPSEAEWDRLIKYVGGDSIAGMKLKDINSFAALAGGAKADEFPVNGIGQTGAWWGTGLVDEQWQYSINFVGENNITKRDLKDDNAFAKYLSIRCVKDN